MTKKSKMNKFINVKNNKLLYAALLWQILWIAIAIIFDFGTAGNPMFLPLAVGAIGYAYARTSSFNLANTISKLLSIIVLSVIAFAVSYYLYFLSAGLLT